LKKQTKFSLDDGLVGLVARHRKFIIKEDMNQGEVVVFKKGVRTRNLSFIGVPVQLDEELLGVLWCEDHQTKKFSDESARALNILASQLSFAWQRAIHHEQEVEHAARDGLTELYNHRRFQEILAEELEKRKELVLLFFDIDHFKKINDTHGHQAGDEVLKFIGKLIRKTGIAARYGGEEFAIILPKYSLEKGIRIASQLKAHLKKSVVTFNDTSIQITVSIGVAHYPSDAKTRHELIEKADRAVYYGKETGRDKIVPAKTVRGKEHQ
jgi:diguanylate cyclase (GGDEF)-like protein